MSNGDCLRELLPEHLLLGFCMFVHEREEYFTNNITLQELSFTNVNPEVDSSGIPTSFHDWTMLKELIAEKKKKD